MALNRRAFLRTTSAWAAAASAAPFATAAVNSTLADSNPPETFGPPAPHLPEPASPADRIRAAVALRKRAADRLMALPLPEPAANGDDAAFPDGSASYSKGLPHDTRGLPEPRAYLLYQRALRSGDPDAFNQIPLGGTMRLENPEAAFALTMAGPESCQTLLPAPPSFRSAEQAGEMVELYWAALCRDVPFAHYDTDPTVAAAADDLSQLTAFRGPREQGRVTPATLFRDAQPGCLRGPFVSQFLLQRFQYGAITCTQKFRVGAPGVDFMTTRADWLRVQNGRQFHRETWDSEPRHAFNARALAEIVHNDPLFQLIYHACCALLFWRATRNATNPYFKARSTQGFVTFGPPWVMAAQAHVSWLALQTVWFNKWLVHRRIRPEELGGRVHDCLTGDAAYPLHRDLLHSKAVQATFNRWGSYLLPQAYPEGCPLHPSYGAGHTAVAASAVTILKAFFDESFVVPNPVQPNEDGTGLVPYTGPELTVGGELDKLASNLGVGRNLAGIHWRSDADIQLGEDVALGYLQEMIHARAFPERFDGFALTRFHGDRVVIG